MRTLDTVKIGERIRNARKSCGLTQTKMAQLVGITQPNYSFYERGVVIPSVEIICKIADVSGMSTDYLLCRTDISMMASDNHA